MSSIPPQPPRNTVTELAKQRTHQAAERTITGWIQNCVALIGFGIAFDHIFKALNQSFPEENSLIKAQLAEVIGLTFIALGIFLLVLAIVQHQLVVQALEQHRYTYLSYRSFLTIAPVAIVLFGLLALVAILLIAV
ncbi:MAG: hypothetical protein Kow00121_65650 [Elainellaceae cyanobacterium]